jgi:hypothetical protein
MEVLMRVLYESPDPELVCLREDAEHRVLRAMRRLAWLVPRVRVRVCDINGPRGGADKRCLLEMKTHGIGTLVVTSLAVDARTALDAALSRAVRVLLRAWRRKATRRGRGRALAPALDL